MRLRIKFHKLGPLRYIGHLDLHKIWERSARRAKIDLIYSQGFHPQPKIQIASALPLGFSSICEIIDLWTSYDQDPIEIKEKLQSALPNGINIETIEIVSDQSPPLQILTESAVYNIKLPEASLMGLAKNINELLGKEQIQRVRRGKPYDLRPLIEKLEIIQDRILVQLSARDSATGRPEELLDELGIPSEACFVERTNLIFKD